MKDYFSLCILYETKALNPPKDVFRCNFLSWFSSVQTQKKLWVLVQIAAKRGFGFVFKFTKKSGSERFTGSDSVRFKVLY